MKKILFLSSVDFKEKSIQVIRKTPEAYKNAGWDVHYVVGRDESVAGDYFYETIVNPEGIAIYRFIIPLAKLHSLFNNKLWRAILFRIRNFLLISGLVLKAIRLSRKNKFDVIYGYEISGVLAARFVRWFGIMRSIPFVTRFQGVLHVKEWLQLNQSFRKITNFEAVMALRTKADLVVMTNDGSQGLDVLKRLDSPNRNILFLSNGVDDPILEEEKLKLTGLEYPADHWRFVSVSRLDAHKRIDRGIEIVSTLIKKLGVKNITYTIIGGGVEEEKLKAIIRDSGLQEHIRMLGPVNHTEVPYHLHYSHFLISMYTSSNVGNPLLESIRMNKPVVTLNNGDTADWIRHDYNGLIYDIEEKDLSPKEYLQIAGDIKHILDNASVYKEMVQNTAVVASKKLWSWKQRMDKEVEVVTLLTESR